MAQRTLVHTVVMVLETDDNYAEFVLCICGELFESFSGEGDFPHSSAIEQMSRHLKEVNRQYIGISREDMEDQPSLMAIIQNDMYRTRGSNAPKPEKPEGDDPRAGRPLNHLQGQKPDIHGKKPRWLRWLS